jgi:uncharacterized protein (DUF1786 family)
LEYDLVFFLEAYQQPVMLTMDMPSSRRHRFVKIREEIVRSKGKPKGQSYSTGIDPQSSDPAMQAAHQRALDHQQR